MAGELLLTNIVTSADQDKRDIARAEAFVNEKENQISFSFPDNQELLACVDEGYLRVLTQHAPRRIAGGDVGALGAIISHFSRQIFLFLIRKNYSKDI